MGRRASTQPRDDGILFLGKWIKRHLQWLTKDLGEMSREEAKAASLLWSVSEWIDWHRLSVREYFALLDRDGTNVVTLEEMIKAVGFMNLENSPSDDDVRQMILLIMTPSLLTEPKTEVDFTTFHMALMIIGKQREHRDRAVNCFLKEFSKMTRLESNATIFLRVLWEVLERKKLTPEELFEKVDEDGNGCIDGEELTRYAHQMMKLQLPPSIALPALAIESPLEMLDMNGDGKVSRAEFCEICHKARTAKIVKAMSDEDKHPIFLSTRAETIAPRELRHIFSTRAFVECLLKVAFVHLGYHGTSAQAEQPAFVKAMWLLVYMHWAFNRTCNRTQQAEESVDEATAPQSPVSSEVESPKSRVSSNGQFPKFITPMQQLTKNHPRLFADTPEMPTTLQMPSWARAASRQSNSSRPGTSATARSAGSCAGWGRLADPALAACLACYEGGRPSAAGDRALDHVLLTAIIPDVTG